MSKKIELEIPEGKRAEWVNGVLTLVDEKPKDVTERIKTFKDACYELGSDHRYVKEYWAMISSTEVKSPEIIAYLMIRIIAFALNEGWEPQNSKENEERYTPDFLFCKEEEAARIADNGYKELKRFNLDDYNTDYDVLICSGASIVPEEFPRAYNQCPYFRTFELARYCGNQFIDIWADYLLARKG